MSVLKTGRRRQNLPKGERRERLLDAALKAFVRTGYHGTHVEQIVKEAGVARGTFYLHFKSKHDVFETLVDRMLAIFLDARPLEPEPEINSLEDAETVLRRSYGAVLSTFREHRKLARLLFDEAVGIDKGFRKKLSNHYRQWHTRVSQLMDIVVQKGVARRDLDVEVTSEMVLGMVERLARRYIFQGEGVDVDRLVDALVRFELNGIQPLHPRPTRTRQQKRT
ncbi:MAG: TetR/AcrR family transcriptional regulator [Planctomycetota bacterium]|jgi:AcrR family transcriptional regulator